MDLDDLQPHPLDEDIVLEPVDAPAPAPIPLIAGDPIVSDVHGRLWRVRRRCALDVARLGPILSALGLVLALLVLVALLV